MGAQRSRPGSCLFPPQCVSASSRPLWQGKSQAAPARTICGPSTKSGQVKEESEEVAGTSPVVLFLLLFFVVHRRQHPPSANCPPEGIVIVIVLVLVLVLVLVVVV